MHLALNTFHLIQMNEYRYILTPYKGPSTRKTCPSCRMSHKFSRYIDKTTGEYLADHVGRCDRENSCGYHFTPKQFFAESPKGDQLRKDDHINHHEIETQNKPISYLPFKHLNNSVSAYQDCNLYPFLSRLFRPGTADYLCEQYFIGANKDRNTVFWQVDINGNVRQAKIMQYNHETGKRNKGFTISFIGKKILGEDANLRQCFFGEYLLSLPENQNKPVIIVESEKSAVIASVYFQDAVWIATGGSNGCKWTEKETAKVLSGRKVILFPDAGFYQKWKAKGVLLGSVANCEVSISDLVERLSTPDEKNSGLDIADYLLSKTDTSGLALTDYSYPVIWDYRGVIPTEKKQNRLIFNENN